MASSTLSIPNTVQNMATTTITASEIETQFLPIKAESLPLVPTFEADANPEDLIKALKISGGCKVKAAVNKDVLAQVERELRPHIEADVVWEGDFFPVQDSKSRRHDRQISHMR